MEPQLVAPIHNSQSHITHSPGLTSDAISPASSLHGGGVAAGACLLLLLSRSVVSDSVTSWTVALQAPLSMGFSRQEYWSGLLFPSSGDFSDPEIKPRSPTLQADSLPLYNYTNSEPQGVTMKFTI